MIVAPKEWCFLPTTMTESWKSVRKPRFLFDVGLHFETPEKWMKLGYKVIDTEKFYFTNVKLKR